MNCTLTMLSSSFLEVFKSKNKSLRLKRGSRIMAVSFVFGTLIFAQQSLGQTASATWTMTSGTTTPSTTGSVTATAPTAGSGITVGALSGTYGYNGTGWSVSPTTPVPSTNTTYFQFSVSPTGSNFLTINSLSLSSVNNEGIPPDDLAIFYSTSSTFATSTSIVTGNSMPTGVVNYSNSSFTATAYSSQTLYFRVYFYYASSGVEFGATSLTLSGTSALPTSPFTFNSSGTFTVPTGVNCLQVQAWGAGGNGGTGTGGGSGRGSGGGGSGANVINNSFSTSGGSSLAIVIGQGGGATGTSGTSNTTINSTTLIAAGGSSNTGNTTTGAAGGTSGSPSTGGTITAGNSGSTNSGTTGGAGGAAPGTGGGTGGSGGSNGNNGNTGNQPGGGGGGGGKNGTGGSGANGEVIIAWVDASNFSTSATSPICTGANTTVSMTSTTLTAGTYNVNYTTTNPGNTTNVSVTFSGSPATGSFTVSGLTGPTSGITINSVGFTSTCGSTPQTGGNTASVTVNMNTAGTPSSTPSLCINSALTNITIATTGATGIGTATGLPSGVTAAWATNVITISGTPTVSGTFNYSIPLSGGCGSVNATGTITVNALPTAALAVNGQTNASCYLSNGSITVAGSGGSGTITGYSVFNGVATGPPLNLPAYQSSPTFSLPAGSYQLRVIDSNGCESKQVR